MLCGARVRSVMTPKSASYDASTMSGGPSGDRLTDPLFARVYESLKGLAHTVRRGRAGDTLSTTALVHEAFLKLSDAGGAAWKDEAHFFAVAARAMRQIIIDAARRDMALKRGGAASKLVSYDDAAHAAAIRPEELVALDTALERLGLVDERRAQVVEHRIFAGLSTAETAALLGVSTGTVERDWRAARAWLSTEIAGAQHGHPA